MAPQRESSFPIDQSREVGEEINGLLRSEWFSVYRLPVNLTSRSVARSEKPEKSLESAGFFLKSQASDR
jgi:hypothetical protein